MPEYWLRRRLTDLSSEEGTMLPYSPKSGLKPLLKGIVGTAPNAALLAAEQKDC